jgi:hypothetical protein
MKRLLVLLISLFPAAAAAQSVPPMRIYDEGTLRPLRYRLNFIGSGVSCVDNAGSSRTDCTVSGGGGGSVDGLLGAYQAASTTAKNVIGLTTALGPVFVRDNSTPTGDYLLAVEDNGGSTDFLSVQAIATQVYPLLSVSRSVTTGQDTALTVGTTNAATAGAQKYSPMFNFKGFGWKTDATAASRRVDMALQLRPVQGAANPTSELVFWSQVNSGGYIERIKLSDATNVSGFGNGNYYFQAGPSGVGVGLLSQGGTGIVATDDNVGTKIKYSNDFLKLNGTSTGGWIANSGATNNVGTVNFLFDVQSSHSLTGDTGIALGTNGTTYQRLSVTSGTAGVYANCLDRTADTAGTTIYRTVEASADNKVAIPAATANLKTIVGVSLKTTTTGQIGPIAYSGDVFVEYGGTVNRKDLLVSDDGTAGKVKTNNSAAAGTIIGIAMEDGGTTTAGQVRMMFRAQ